MTYDVAIIGGGISGLTTAYELTNAGHNVVVLERQQQVGGNAISERIDGFLMEHGPTTLNAMVPQALDLASRLGLDGEKIDLGEGVKKRYLRDGDELFGIPVKPTGFLMSSYLSLPARLSVLAEIFRPAKTTDEDESVYAFTCRRFGREFAEKVMEPLAAGMFGGDSRYLSVGAVFPKLKEMEQVHGSITRAVIKAKKDSEPGKRLFSFRDGVAALPKALARRLHGRVKTGVTVKSLAKAGEGYKINTAGEGVLNARTLVLAVQPHVAAGLLEPLDDGATNAAASISAPPMSVVFLTYDHNQVQHPLDSLGFLSVKGKDGLITGAQFSSTMFDGRAPNGFASISAYVGGVRNPDAAGLDKSDLVPLVHAELQNLLQISGEPLSSRCHQWARSLPQYELGHAEKIEPLMSTSQNNPGLYVTGNFLAGVSIANCIKQAGEVAANIDRYLSESTSTIAEKSRMA